MTNPHSKRIKEESLSETKLPHSKRIAVLTGSIGIFVIVIGLIAASLLSCREIGGGYGPWEYVCPDGIYWGDNPHPYFDMFVPWLIGGMLVILWAAYRYESARTRISKI